ncbi:MAG: hypothetical protein J5827_05450, partial [Oscillospiraceae bacterium]|nr:hypothetical protein [Oscillospiraceae bacterium]
RRCRKTPGSGKKRPKAKDHQRKNKDICIFVPQVILFLLTAAPAENTVRTLSLRVRYTAGTGHIHRRFNAAAIGRCRKKSEGAHYHGL